MTDKTTLKGYFETGDIPSQGQFETLIDTMVAEGGSTGVLAGAINVGTDAVASEADAVAIGTSAIASAAGAVQFGAGTNALAASLKVGSSPRLVSGVPASPADGDIWIDTGVVKIGSGTASVEVKDYNHQDTYYDSTGTYNFGYVGMNNAWTFNADLEAGTNLKIADGGNISVGETTGSQIGTSASQKLGFWGTTPTTQPAAFTQTFATTSTENAAVTAAGITQTSTSIAPTSAYVMSYGFSTDQEFTDAVACVNALVSDVGYIKSDLDALRTDIESIKATVNGLIDMLQTIGIIAGDPV